MTFPYICGKADRICGKADRSIVRRLVSTAGMLAVSVFVSAGVFSNAAFGDQQDGDSVAAVKPLHPLAAEIKSQLADRPADKPFVAAVTLKANPGAAKKVVAAMREATPITRKEEGNVAYLLLRDPSDKNLFVLFERWKSLDSLNAHLHAEHTVKLLETLEPLLSEAPKVDVMYPVFFPRAK
ncbi:putative quinol monooxygenase [Crateriforma conspicua]|uniref:Autoinducer-2 (AI-2) modifying protein LsrG n=1 Tax=Crateriforma conspicua TaxID=2527996 RepID=A0A5C6FVD2_9PLAN|nr:putative quinol monooxygenase [Crateriforma conspicua]TWU65565.1 autoinducer-2 (AI-2) modifying protein LsrG [Crateriforma conspicua]